MTISEFEGENHYSIMDGIPWTDSLPSSSFHCHYLEINAFLILDHLNVTYFLSLESLRIPSLSLVFWNIPMTLLENGLIRVSLFLIHCAGYSVGPFNLGFMSFSSGKYYCIISSIITSVLLVEFLVIECWASWMIFFSKYGNQECIFLRNKKQIYF